jgi:hypothetical protein
MKTGLKPESAVSDKDLKGIENQIMGYHEAQDRYAVESAGEIKCVDSGGLFQKNHFLQLYDSEVYIEDML